MKLKYFLLAFFCLSLCYSQGHGREDERFSFGIYTEPQHFLSNNPDVLIHWEKADGYNIGTSFELQQQDFYIRVRTFLFPDLNDLSYADFDAGIGLNWRSPKDRSRLYAGGFGGLISRGEGVHPKFGLEAGYQFYFKSGIFVGIKTDYQYKHDDKTWRHIESGHSVWSGGIEVGYSWYFDN